MKTEKNSPTKLSDFQKSRGELIVNRCTKHNNKGEGYKIPESYNSSYGIAATFLIAKKVLRFDSSRGNKGGLWLVRQPKVTAKKGAAK
jgi:hypothetical protein